MLNIMLQAWVSQVGMTLAIQAVAEGEGRREPTKCLPGWCAKPFQGPVNFATTLNGHTLWFHFRDKGTGAHMAGSMPPITLRPRWKQAGLQGLI